MARKSKDGINKSQAIRDMLAKSPEMKVKDLVAQLASQGIHVQPNLVYFIKGKTHAKGRRRRNTSNAVGVATSSGSGDALATVIKVKKLAAEVGGLRTLKALVDALSE